MNMNRQETEQAIKDFQARGGKIKKITDKEARENPSDFIMWADRFYGGVQDPLEKSYGCLLTI